METIKTTAKTILSNMGIIAVVGLLAYVLYCEFIRPAPSRREINEALSLVKETQVQLANALTDLDTAQALNRQISSSNHGFLTQSIDLFRELRTLNDSLNVKQLKLSSRAKVLEDQYKAKKLRLQEAKQIAL